MLGSILQSCFLAVQAVQSMRLGAQHIPKGQAGGMVWALINKAATANAHPVHQPWMGRAGGSGQVCRFPARACECNTLVAGCQSALQRVAG